MNKAMQFFLFALEYYKIKLNTKSNSIVVCYMNQDIQFNYDQNEFLISQYHSSSKNFSLQKEADLIIEHQKHSNTQSLLMKHAIANSVRLCVVAPTVHVHIADEEHRLQSG